LLSSEDITITWIKRKGFLVKHKPAKSRFSLSICLSISIGAACGFLIGFVFSGFASRHNYSLIYENLLTELENTRKGLEEERSSLKSKKFIQEKRNKVLKREKYGDTLFMPEENIAHEQAISSVFGHAIELLQKNDLEMACKELKNIMDLGWRGGEWRNKSISLLKSKCRGIISL